MATSYKTPGVFVEEITKFPPSVAQVETAIPAFIGYTEKATDISANDLILKPKRIGSMVEYVHYYGEGPKTIVTRVDIDDKFNFKNATAKTQYYMYDSLRMFFANGGGDCIIVSVDLYDVNKGIPTVADFTNGITKLLKEDDPTMVLTPDAVLLNDTDLGTVQKAALLHCADESRMDRVAIFDLRSDDTTPENLGKNFKLNVGVNSLSYGAAYTPWLRTNLPKKVTYADILGKIYQNGATVSLSSLIASDDPNKADLTAAIDQLGKVFGDIDKIATTTSALSGTFNNLNDNFTDLVIKYNQAPQSVSKFKAIITFVNTVFVAINGYLKAADPSLLANTKLTDAIKASVTSDFIALCKNFIQIDAEAVADAKVKTDYGTAAILQTQFDSPLWPANMVADAGSSTYMTATDKMPKCNQAVAKLQEFWNSLNRAYYLFIVDAASSVANTQNTSLQKSLPVFSSIIRGVSNSISELPPSGAIAGIYALVDRTRGVWKAPANVSLNNVIEPTQTYTKSQLDNLNVDVYAGKSINAIRTFFGKGTLVYGARTLAGNDNEWRYISVRRLFVMVEESVKKATEQFVFEPNDSNTWVKVQAMIENFLYNIWRQGALQGIKPEHAFYVAVGLNKTMNPIDILEGRMIIEIGMAAVRPAEFIILRFSHKMAES